MNEGRAAAVHSDWHIHSRNSCDCKEAPIPTTMAETVAAIQAAGVIDFGITDHLHTPLNLPDIAASRREFDALPSSPHRHFGIEVSCVSTWELATIAERCRTDSGQGGNPGATAGLSPAWRDQAIYGLRAGGPAHGAMAIGITADEIARFGIEYVVGGTHWPLYVLVERESVIRDYHRQNVFLACHPLVTIVAHPWWWMGRWQEADGSYRTDPWFDDFRKVPRSMHDEFASAAREHGKVVEVNLHAMLLNRTYPERFRHQYCEYLAGLHEAGVPLSIGSDHHAQYSRYGEDESVLHLPESQRAQLRFGVAVAMLNAVGIDEQGMWRLPASAEVRSPPVRCQERA